MDAAVQRCKTIVSGILMSAGEARGEAPQLTTMRASFNEIIAHTRAVRRPGTVEFNDRFGADVAIVSDPALRQVIGRSEERRGGKEGVSACRSRWSPVHEKKKKK